VKYLKYLFVLFYLYSALVAAEQGAIVKCVQPDGTVVYTNKKCEYGKALEIQRHSHYAAPTTITAEFAFASQQSHVEITGQGTVIKILHDDNNGGMHQKFIIKLSNGQTLLVAHNIDLAPRIDSLREGDLIQFYGEYLWNEKGGLLHWTHHDPKRVHEAGWLKFNDRVYE